LHGTPTAVLKTAAAEAVVPSAAAAVVTEQPLGGAPAEASCTVRLVKAAAEIPRRGACAKLVGR
jgi:hypothetical protein